MSTEVKPKIKRCHHFKMCDSLGNTNGKSDKHYKAKNCPWGMRQREERRLKVIGVVISSSSDEDAENEDAKSDDAKSLNLFLDESLDSEVDSAVIAGKLVAGNCSLY